MPYDWDDLKGMIEGTKMRALILGADSCIGKALATKLEMVSCWLIETTRRRPHLQHQVCLDLAEPIPTLPPCDIAFLCAGIKGMECERDKSMSWRVNVDGILAAGKQLMRANTFVVYVSSDAVEWSDSAYARQKAYVELGLQMFGEPAIVRCQRFDDATAPQAARAMISIAQARQAGIHHRSATADAKRMAA